ncbi:MAG: hypothetical protein AAF558_06860, partial [Verrucomicrobiota bacterium]
MSKIMRVRWIFGLWVAFSFLVISGHGQKQVPKALEDWKDWATWDEGSRECPTLYNKATEHLCYWSSELVLEVGAKSGTFRLDLKVFHESWIALPGDQKFWPQNVVSSGINVPVTLHRGRPSIKVAQGSYQIRGGYSWQSLPRRIPIPKEIGILSLVLNGEDVEFPNRDSAGNLWLSQSRRDTAEKDFMSIKIYRLIEDGIPMWLRTEVELSVSGKSREEELGNLLPEGWILSSVTSPIPVAVDDSGKTKVQVRAGKWNIRLNAFRTTHPEKIAYANEVVPSVESEIIGFKALPEFRMVDIEGLRQVDVTQTTFPNEWKAFPVFYWDTKTEFTLSEQMRGMGLRRPEGLSVQREFWIERQGKPIIFRDRISGTMQQTWRLDASTGHELGAVRINESGQLITKNPETGAQGVEIRERNISLEAVGRTKTLWNASASGWQTDVDQLQGVLNLPPGWRLVGVTGVDWVEGDWITSWSLYDLFVLLIFVIAVYRLWGWKSGMVALVATTLYYHEPTATMWPWFFLLVPLALIRVIPEGRFLKIVNLWKWGALGVLVVCLVPFYFQQIQGLLYPQLETKPMR